MNTSLAHDQHTEDRPPACQRPGAFSLGSSDQGQRPRSIGRPEAYPPALYALTLCALLLTPCVLAGSRTSTNYTITTDTVSHGGTRTTSAAYTNDGSAGGSVGISTVTTPAETMKHGYIAQLTEVTALQLAASPTTVNEGSTRQLTATATLDDATTSALLASDVTWSVQSGPLTSISASGLATADIVYQNTAATAQGVYSGITGSLNLTVINTNTDDIPGYSGDGLDDAWQVQYFGLSNPNAAPTQDPDFDSQNNLFEYIAGVIPTNASSRFLISIAAVPDQPQQKNIVFSPRLADRIYTMQTSTTLLGPSWTPLTTFTLSDNGLTRTLTDTNATETRKFYRVDISKP